MAGISNRSRCKVSQRWNAFHVFIFLRRYHRTVSLKFKLLAKTPTAHSLAFVVWTVFRLPSKNFLACVILTHFCCCETSKTITMHLRVQSFCSLDSLAPILSHSPNLLVVVYFYSRVTRFIRAWPHKSLKGKTGWGEYSKCNHRESHLFTSL